MYMKTSPYKYCPGTTVCLMAILMLALCAGCPTHENNQSRDTQDGKSRTSEIEPRLPFDGTSAVEKIVEIDPLTPETLKREIGQPSWTASDSEGGEALYYYCQDAVAIVTFRNGIVGMVEAFGNHGKLIKRVRLDQEEQEEEASDEPTD